MLILAFSIVCVACVDNQGAYYGVHGINLRDGEQVYIKRMVWGRALDNSITTISLDRELCDVRRASEDYIFDWFQPTIYYKVEQNKLKIYVFGKSARPPVQGKFPIEVEQIVLDAPAYIDLMNNYERLGITRKEAAVNERLHTYDPPACKPVVDIH